MNDDSALYTGVDNEANGQFDNEIKNEETEQKIQDQTRLIKELTPKLQELLDIIDTEIKGVNTTTDLVLSLQLKDITPEIMTIEVLARASYVNYLGGLKTKFTLALQETKK